MTDKPRVVVVGAGLAGLAAAVKLAPSHEVIVVESASIAGGQCAGERVGNEARDRGVHGVYPRYWGLRELLAEVGARPALIRADHQHVVTPEGAVARIRMPRLPAPLHCSTQWLLSGTLKLSDRLRSSIAAARLLALDPDDSRLDGIDIHSLGARLGIPRDAFRLIAEPLAWIAFFLPPTELSAAAYLGALRFLILGRSDSWRASWVPTPNGETLVLPLVNYIRRHGGQVRLECAAVGLDRGGDRVTAVRVEVAGRQERIPAHWVLLALPAVGAAGLLATSGLVAEAARLRSLGTAWVGTHRFWFAPGPRAALVHGVVLTPEAAFMYFALDRFMPAWAGTERVVEVQYSPEALAGGEAALLANVRRLLPDGDGASLLRQRAEKPIPYARYAVGAGAARPDLRGPMPNLLYAGDWVREPGGTWFMERAVTTGGAAASFVLGQPSPARPRLESTATGAARLLARLTLGPQW